MRLIKWNIITVILLTISFITTVNASIAEPALSLPTLPQQYLESHFKAIQASFDQRATFFLKGRHYQNWSANKSRADILKEFDQINEWRFHAWYVDPNAKTLISRIDFMVAQDLLEKGLYRKPGFIAFQYNQTDGTYNSSTILLNGFKFLALESPSAKTLRNFFLLLQNHRVTQIINLSSMEERGSEKSFPYWNGKLKVDTKTQEMFLNVPQQNNPSAYRLRYYSIDRWTDNQGIRPNTLLKLILSVRKGYDPNGIIACHSGNGIGRTGTFLAGFLLLNEIDRQLAAGATKSTLDISIEKMVMQLSLQRPYLVRKPEQYVALYRLVDFYLDTIK